MFQKAHEIALTINLDEKLKAISYIMYKMAICYVESAPDSDDEEKNE